jgi:dTDP-4-amino-4,6-dideoxygalactose transaminase
VLLGQLERGEAITAARRLLWQAYHEAFADAETEEVVTRPRIAPDVHHNGHIYYLLARDRRSRDRAISGLAERGIAAHFHYVPLHSSSAGLRYGRAHGELRRTEDVAGRLVRLPMWVGLTAADVDRIATLTLGLLR